MRFHGMVGDRVSISMAGQAWRPPDYITSPTRKLRPESELRIDDDPTEKSERSKRLKKGVMEGKAKPHKSKLKSGMNQTRINKIFQKQASRADRCLPFPSTHTRNVHRHRRLTHRQRILAIALAILMAFALFASLVTLLSQQLQNVASKVDAQNEILRQSHHFSERFQSAAGNNHSPGERRKLLQAGDIAGSKKTQTELVTRTNNGFLAKLIKSMSAIQHIFKILNSDYETRPAITASLLHNARLPISQASASLTAPSPQHVDAGARIKNLQEELQKIYEDLLLGRVRAPLQVPQGEATIVPHEMILDAPSTTAASGFSRRVMKDPSLENPSGSSWARKRLVAVESPQALSPKVLHSSALSVIGNVGSPDAATPPNKSASELRHTQQTAPSPVLAKPLQAMIQPNTWNIARANSLRTSQALQFSQIRNTPEGVEVWAMPRGKSLCRLFNIARLSDGRLVLPKWMKQHADFLSSRCGIKGAIFAVENMSSTHTLQVDDSLLQKLIKSQYEVDRTNSGRDLCGTIAPRNHMPHFVTDILLPLVASETLLGSGKLYLQSSILLPTEPKGIDVRSALTFSDFKPSLLVFEETWNRPSSEWVPRLAQFFLHPRIGFTLLRAGKEKGPRTPSPRSKLRMSAFRSVVTSNLESHFPLALFGPEGKNIVFDFNGISRSPAWTTQGMRENPCRVTITVLTRKGPRALLRLNELEKKIKLHSKAAAVRVNFNVVDFEDSSFDEQVRTMQETNILIATHGAGNANFIFMRPSAAVIEIFPFSYKAGPFDSFARIFGLKYSFAMSAPQTDVFKECMYRHESNHRIQQLAFSRWDKAVQEEKSSPWIHRLEFEKEFGEPGKSEGMTTRMCVRLQELEFNIDAVSRMAVDSGTAQCSISRRI